MLGLGQRTPVRARGEMQQRVQMLRFRLLVLLFQAAQRGVDPVEMIAYGLWRDGIVIGIGRGLREIRVAQLLNDGFVGDLVIEWTRRAGFGALTRNFAALIEVILLPGAGGIGGDEIELVPTAGSAPSGPCRPESAASAACRRGSSPWCCDSRRSAGGLYRPNRRGSSGRVPRHRTCRGRQRRSVRRRLRSARAPLRNYQVRIAARAGAR